MRGVRSDHLGHILTALPIAHVLGASLFLWAYCISFGANLIAHVSVTDLLAVSIADMVSSYVFAVVVPPITLIVVRAILPEPATVYGWLGHTPDPDNFEETEKRLSRWFVASAVLYFAPFLALAIIDYARGFPFRYFWPVVALIPAVMPATLWLRKALHLSHASYAAIVFALTFAVCLISFGVNRGQKDRFLTYSLNAKHYSICKNALIVRRFGNLYLAVLPDDQKALLDGDCKTRYTFPEPIAERVPVYKYDF